MREPSPEEIQECLKQLNTGKAPGLDGIPVELLMHGGANLYGALKQMILSVWDDGPMTKDWIDAFLVILYKGKGKNHSVAATVASQYLKLLAKSSQGSC